MKSPRLLMVALACLVATGSYAEMRRVEKTVWGEAVLGSHMTDQQAKRAAVNDARAKAIEEAAGVRVDTAWLGESSLERAHFLQALAHGYIVEEEVLEWASELRRDPNDAKAPPITVHRVRLRATVEVPPKSATPDFEVRAKLNRTTFEAGDSAVLDIDASRDAWVYVFNLMANDTASLLCPNRWQPGNRVARAEKLVFPAPGCGVNLEMQLLPGDPESAESFLVVAFPEDLGLERRLEPGAAYPLPELYRRLTAFPLEKAAMTLVPYVVKAKP